MDGYYDHLIKQFERMVQTGLLNKVHLNTLIVAQTVEEVLVKMKAHQPKTGINLLNIDRI
jgi:predicted Rossmann-fold nucleotide-binding protein